MFEYSPCFGILSWIPIAWFPQLLDWKALFDGPHLLHGESEQLISLLSELFPFLPGNSFVLYLYTFLCKQGANAAFDSVLRCIKHSAFLSATWFKSAPCHPATGHLRTYVIMWMAFGSSEYSEMAEVLLLLPASNIYFDRGAGYFRMWYAWKNRIAGSKFAGSQVVLRKHQITL